MACPGFAICPNADGTIDGCKRTCACVYCGNASQVTACQGQCVASSGQPSVGINPQPAQDAINGALSGIFAPLLQSLPLILERVGLFLFAMILVIVGLLSLKQ